MVRKVRAVIVAAVVVLCGLMYAYLGTGDPEEEESRFELGALTETGTESGQETEAEETGCVLHVYVCGCVKSPGVYETGEGAIVNDVIGLAGGLAEGAEAAAVNLAAKVKDGDMIYIPSAEEAAEGLNGRQAAFYGDGLTDINRAGEEELVLLPGIGPSKAKDIVAYRQEHGAFEKIEDIMNVPGIKKGTFDKIKTLIKAD
ncbi:MAG: helix-hairpin-helix domain-containing protein [Lachnospiraceae bacterium]|nr:helix-hairpin-helix domain-containing protein [Lachnospiraceae bacterium]